MSNDLMSKQFKNLEFRFLFVICNLDFVIKNVVAIQALCCFLHY